MAEGDLAQEVGVDWWKVVWWACAVAAIIVYAAVASRDSERD